MKKKPASRSAGNQEVSKGVRTADIISGEASLSGTPAFAVASVEVKHSRKNAKEKGMEKRKEPPVSPLSGWFVGQRQLHQLLPRPDAGSLKLQDAKK